MNPVLIVILIIAVIVVIAVIAQKAAERERQRLSALAQWADLNGFRFSLDDPINLDSRFSGLADIGKGHRRYAYEVLARAEPVPTFLFRYRFDTTETRTVTRNNRSYTETYEQTHWRAYLIIELQTAFPKLFIRPENFLDKLKGLVGFEDINFESEAFSRKYFVKSDNRAFAYAIIHPQMMDWMMDQEFHGELGTGVFLMDILHVPPTCDGRLLALAQATGFIDRIPDFVWQDYGQRTPVKLPLPAGYVPPPPIPTLSPSLAPPPPRPEPSAGTTFIGKYP